MSMCGIAGVYGNKAIVKALIIILNQLERGTQGCGIAWIKRKKIKIMKEPIHPTDFVLRNYKRLDTRAKIAIAHNRLPSAGKVSYENTHPFMACNREFALVHNGHVFNGHLRRKLKAEGHRIMGQTDSEVLTHVLEDLVMEYGDMVEALKELAEDYLVGAILVLTKDGKLYGVKSGGYPLHYAEVDGEIYLGSTERAVKAVCGKSAKIKELKEGQIAEVDRGVLKIHGEPKERPKVSVNDYDLSPFYGIRRKSLWEEWFNEWANGY